VAGRLEFLENRSGLRELGQNSGRRLRNGEIGGHQPPSCLSSLLVEFRNAAYQAGKSVRALTQELERAAFATFNLLEAAS